MAEDSIAKQGTDGLRLCINLSDTINDQGMKIATLEHTRATAVAAKVRHVHRAG